MRPLNLLPTLCKLFMCECICERVFVLWPLVSLVHIWRSRSHSLTRSGSLRSLRGAAFGHFSHQFMTAKQTICAKQNSIIKAFVVLVPNLLLPEGASMGRSRIGKWAVSRMGTVVLEWAKMVRILLVRKDKVVLELKMGFAGSKIFYRIINK